MRLVGVFPVQHDLAIARHFDGSRFRARVGDRQAASFGFGIGSDDHVHPCLDVTDSLEELSLVVGEHGAGRFSRRPSRACGCRPPPAVCDVPQEQEGAAIIDGGVGTPARDCDLAQTQGTRPGRSQMRRKRAVRQQGQDAPVRCRVGRRPQRHVVVGGIAGKAFLPLGTGDRNNLARGLFL